MQEGTHGHHNSSKMSFVTEMKEHFDELTSEIYMNNADSLAKAQDWARKVLTIAERHWKLSILEERENIINRIDVCLILLPTIPKANWQARDPVIGSYMWRALQEWAVVSP